MKKLKLKLAFWVLNYALGVILKKIEFKKIEDGVETAKSASNETFALVSKLIDALRDGKITSEEAHELFVGLDQLLKGSIK